MLWEALKIWGVDMQELAWINRIKNDDDLINAEFQKLIIDKIFMQIEFDYRNMMNDFVKVSVRNAMIYKSWIDHHAFEAKVRTKGKLLFLPIQNTLYRFIV